MRIEIANCIKCGSDEISIEYFQSEYYGVYPTIGQKPFELKFYCHGCKISRKQTTQIYLSVDKVIEIWNIENNPVIVKDRLLKSAQEYQNKADLIFKYAETIK